MYIVADIEGKKKGLKPSKKKSKDDKPADMAMPSGETSQPTADDGGNDEDENEPADDGPIENLMEKGKKISLDDFNMLKVIGRGSFGKVYLVRHKET